MNKCHFLGKVAYEPEVYDAQGTQLIQFVLEIEEYRKDKHGSKKRRVDLLDFEAWDSAANAIRKYARMGDIMAVEAVARKDKDDFVSFRVTTFKILPQDDLDY